MLVFCKEGLYFPVPSRIREMQSKFTVSGQKINESSTTAWAIHKLVGILHTKYHCAYRGRSIFRVVFWIYIYICIYINTCTISNRPPLYNPAPWDLFHRERGDVWRTRFQLRYLSLPLRLGYKSDKGYCRWLSRQVPMTLTEKSMGILPDTEICGLRMRRECRERIPATKG